MSEQNLAFAKDDQVQHARFGTGQVIADIGPSAVVRFEHGIEECLKESLLQIETPIQALIQQAWHPPLEVISRVQAELIESINDAWGVFSRARIALLPHQLWVCKRALEKWPARWLVADDVGLGKTIEAGLILWPLIASGQVRRLLIICPASLAAQWQYRLLNMFDIRLSLYTGEADRGPVNFFDLHSQVVVSLQTIRADNNERHNRLFESEPWDLLVVDEAHHLNADEDQGPTLGYKLVNRLVEENRVRSMLFFTGTPHRGKNFGFLALMRLLRPDLFDPRKPLVPQLKNLGEVVIRNNKQNVTDLRGRRLFHAPEVLSKTYEYSELEVAFYEMLTSFISTGKAYASNLSSQDSRAVMLVLITMQKLASSSVAAIRRALKGRLARLEENRARLDQAKREREHLAALNEALRLERISLDDAQDKDIDSIDSEDLINAKEEEILRLTAAVRLMEDEEPRLRMLVKAAEAVLEETKILRILQVLREQFADEPVLFFTEYKATQSLLMSCLNHEYGDGCVAFINGDERADDVRDSKGMIKSYKGTRIQAAERFNAGEVRFLVSTEAGGEGIDLQERCHCMIHVDLPWNPMRLHQRVGRLNRYGQTHPVRVVSLRNPDTVESRIWDRLTEKIGRIQLAMSNIMDEPEDLMQLVLGMTSPSLFRELFAEGADVSRESLAHWFDEKTASFGGSDALDIVSQLVGHCSKFDYQEVSSQLPRLDLPDLRSFLHSMLVLNGRRLNEDDGQFSFKTPQEWLEGEPGIRENYTNLILNRNDRSRDAASRILGVGHKVLDKAIAQAKRHKGCITFVSEEALAVPLMVFRIVDRITGEGGRQRSVIVAVELVEGNPEQFRLVRDVQLLPRLNEIAGTRSARVGRTTASAGSRQSEQLRQKMVQAREFIASNLGQLNLTFQMPHIDLLAIIAIEKE